MKLQIVETANRRISNKKFRMVKCGIARAAQAPRGAQSFFKNNNDRIPYFDIRYSLFQSFFFKPAVVLTGGGAEHCHLKLLVYYNMLLEKQP